MVAAGRYTNPDIYYTIYSLKEKEPMLPTPPFQLPQTSSILENFARENNLCQQMLVVEVDPATKVATHLYLRSVSDVSTLIQLHTDPAQLAVPQQSEKE